MQNLNENEFFVAIINDDWVNFYLKCWLNIWELNPEGFLFVMLRPFETLIVTL